MGKARTAHFGSFRVALLVAGAGILASCAGNPVEPAPVEMPGNVAAIAPTKPPTRASDSAPAHTYYITVQRGQSLGRVAQAYGVPKQAIIAANNLTPPYDLKIGARLAIPGGASAPVHSATATEHTAASTTMRSKREPEVIPLDD